METRANHVLIGGFTLLAIAIALAFGLWASRHASTANQADFEIRFSQAVAGLSTGSQVQYNGILVGNVRELFLDPKDPRQVVARIRINADAPVREDTVAQLRLAGLTGASFIQLSGGSPDSPPRRAAPGQQLPVIPAEESALRRLIESSEDIATKAGEALDRLVNLLSEDNARMISESLANINSLTKTLGKDSERLGQVMANAAAASGRLDELISGAQQAMGTINQALVHVDQQLVPRLPEISGDLARLLANAADLTARAEHILMSNEGTLANFGGEVLGQLGPTLAEVRILTGEIAQILRRFERNPADFLLGRQQPEEFRP